ncbi:Rha family transcriptional regulator [Clostridium sp. VAP41]|uniref:Rha family transcriptional regulator n=1 Tax=Clostridium sp. VAP41 TaxID=2949979 RepID=UPI0020796E75|nr:Rha family transcriptional regulator [Clostridium sp. VAP41]
MTKEMEIDSREVAKMIGKEHKILMRDIRNYIEYMGTDLDSHNFFMKSTYLDTYKREKPCYLLTKKGCDLVANKMTGSKGILFTAIYVTKFEEIEKKLKSNVIQRSKEQELVLAIYNGGIDAVHATKELTQLKSPRSCDAIGS